MALSFRSRILAILLLLGALPTATLIIGWAITLRTVSPSGATGLAIEDISTAGRFLVESIDTTSVDSTAQRALTAGIEALNQSLGEAQRSMVYLGYYAAGLAVVILLLGAVLVYASVILAGHLSRQLSRPIHELVGWTDRIRQRQPLPEGPPPRGAPEFALLRSALRDMAGELDAGRQRELEAERLRAFREVARRVAHEMKNPLTPIRFAIDQLARTGGAHQDEVIEVLRAETAQLEHLAREFTEFGRLPTGPAAPVDLDELLEELVRSSVPETMGATADLCGAGAIVTGHYDPLRRAFGNLIKNAVEATTGTGALTVTTTVEADDVVVHIADDGPGIPPDRRDRVFDPYVTSKTEGTGLGLALVRQTVEQHGGTVAVAETGGGGATFVVRLPRDPTATGEPA
jgi:signal transduction histidine kinase